MPLTLKKRTAMNKIHIITTGGTISAQKNQHNLSEPGKISAEKLTAAIEIPENCSLVYYHAAAIDSSLMSFDILLDIAAYLKKVLTCPDTLGAVITHGTDTLEESAYFLSLCCPNNKPVIVTGSQRGSEETGTDAFANLQDALRAVSALCGQDIGVAVLFNQALYMPKYVHKNHTHFLHAFTAPYYGMLGTVDGKHVHIPQKPNFFELYEPIQPVPEIDIYKASLGCTGDALQFYVQNGYRAVVIEAFGRGNVTARLAENIRKLTASGCLAVICSDCANGSVLPCYDFEGGLGKLIEYGAIPAFDYSAKKARIKLAVLLAAGIGDKEKITAAFLK